MIYLEPYDIAHWICGGEGNYYAVFATGEIRICDQDCIDAGGYEISPIIYSIKCPSVIPSDLLRSISVLSCGAGNYRFPNGEIKGEVESVQYAIERGLLPECEELLIATKAQQ